MDSEEPTAKENEEEAPFLKSWRNMYFLVIGTMLFLILIFYIITCYFR